MAEAKGHPLVLYNLQMAAAFDHSLDPAVIFPVLRQVLYPWHIGWGN